MKKISVLLCLIAILSAMFALTTQAHYLDDARNAYNSVLDSYSGNTGEDRTYALYDINKDSIPELIIKTGMFEVDRLYRAYTYKSGSGSSFLGYLPSTHILCSYPNGNGMFSFGAKQGGEWVYLVEMVNGGLKDTLVVDKYCPGEYDKIGDLFPGSVELTEYSIYDRNYLTNYFSSAKAYISGNSTSSTQKQSSVTTKNVYNTDIRTYINDVEIPCFVVDGRCVVVAEDLANYFFEVSWSASSRTLDLKNVAIFDDLPPRGMNIAPKNKPGSVFAKTYATDVKVRLWGEEIPSYSLNGYMLVPVESMSCWSWVVYNDNLRRLDLYMAVG